MNGDAELGATERAEPPAIARDCEAATLAANLGDGIGWLARHDPLRDKMAGVLDAAVIKNASR